MGTMKKPQPQMEWTVDGMDDVMATADDDPTADEVRAALHFDGRVMARLELSPREGPGPNGSKPKFGKKSRYHAPALICAHEVCWLFTSDIRCRCRRAP
jgi:hypothetical protein